MLKFRWETQFQKTELGEIPQEWKVYPLAQLNIQVIDGDRGKNYPKQSEFLSEGYCLFLTAKNVTREGFKLEDTLFISKDRDEKMGKGRLQRYDIVLTTRGTVGNVAYYDDKIPYEHMRINSGMVIIRNNSDLDTEFLYHLFKSPALGIQIETVAYGTAQPQLNVKLIKDFKIIVPPPPEQRRIAAVLSWFDDLIENKKRQNEILEKTAMALFKSWFVDFEPFRDEEFVYNEELGREVPRRWEVRSVSEIADIILGGTPKRSVPKYWNGNIKWATAKDIANSKGIFVLDTSEYITEAGLANSNAKLLPKNTVVITARGTVGEVRLLGEDMSFNQTCYGLIPKGYIGSYFLFLALRAHIHHIKTLTYGTVFETITMKSFNDIPVLLPPAPILQRFHEMVEPLFRKIINNEKEIMVLKKARDALLPLLVFGKLRVEVIE